MMKYQRLLPPRNVESIQVYGETQYMNLGTEGTILTALHSLVRYGCDLIGVSLISQGDNPVSFDSYNQMDIPVEAVLNIPFVVRVGGKDYARIKFIQSQKE